MTCSLMFWKRGVTRWLKCFLSEIISLIPSNHAHYKVDLSLTLNPVKKNLLIAQHRCIFIVWSLKHLYIPARKPKQRESLGKVLTWRATTNESNEISNLPGGSSVTTALNKYVLWWEAKDTDLVIAFMYWRAPRKEANSYVYLSKARLWADLPFNQWIRLL